MLKGSVRVPQCRGAYSSKPAAANRAHTHRHAHRQAHTPNTWILLCAHMLHTIWSFIWKVLWLWYIWGRRIKIYAKVCSIHADYYIYIYRIFCWFCYVLVSNFPIFHPSQAIWELCVLSTHSHNMHTARETETEWRRYTEWKSLTDVEWQAQNWAK